MAGRMACWTPVRPFLERHPATPRDNVGTAVLRGCCDYTLALISLSTHAHIRRRAPVRRWRPVAAGGDQARGFFRASARSAFQAAPRKIMMADTCIQMSR